MACSLEGWGLKENKKQKGKQSLLTLFISVSNYVFTKVPHVCQIKHQNWSSHDWKHMNKVANEGREKVREREGGNIMCLSML